MEIVRNKEEQGTSVDSPVSTGSPRNLTISPNVVKIVSLVIGLGLIAAILSISFYVGKSSASVKVSSIVLNTISYKTPEDRNRFLSFYDKIIKKLNDQGYKESWVRIENGSISLLYGRFSSKDNNLLNKISKLKIEVDGSNITFDKINYIYLN
ncbi:MAG: hypothetical protein HY606_08540 [Planctomycetes bacterium]|nr:hypothetical protein [Planctomycetota bacterium]